MLKDFQSLEENELENDACIGIFTNVLQNQYDEEEVNILSYHFFDLIASCDFQNGQRFINSDTPNCPKIIFVCHIAGEIGHWVTLMQILEK